MPTVCLGHVKDPEIWFRGYEQTYLERDVRELSRVGDLTALRTLLRLIALRTGQLLSPTQLGRDAKLNAVTVSRYLALFEASFLIHRVPPYLSNRSSRLIKSPKVYMTDAGLAAHLAGVDRSASLSGDPLYGPLFETYVAQNLRSILNSRWQGAALHFWMVQDGMRSTSSSMPGGPVSPWSSSPLCGGASATLPGSKPSSRPRPTAERPSSAITGRMR